MKHKNIFWGLIFLCGAGVIIGNQLGFFTQIGLSSLLLALVLVFIIIKGIIDINFFEILIPISIILIIFAKPLGIEYLAPWPIIAASLLASIGLSLIFKKPKWKKHKQINHNNHNLGEKFENIDEDIIVSKTSFSGDTKYLYSKNLKKADFNVSFGGLKVFFDQVTLRPEGADINIDASFAGIELYIPRNWNIINNISATVGGVDVKGLRSEETGPTLRLEGHITFSGVEINYI